MANFPGQIPPEKGTLAANVIPKILIRDEEAHRAQILARQGMSILRDGFTQTPTLVDDSNCLVFNLVRAAMKFGTS